MTVEQLCVREPVNNGRQNHRTFSREQLATVLDESSTILAAPHEETETGRRRPFDTAGAVEVVFFRRCHPSISEV